MDFVTDHSSPAMGAFGPSDTFIAGRDVPPGSIGWHVDCSGNPLDLRPAVNAILQAIEEKLPSASPEKPLVVLFGEQHTRPARNQILPITAKRFATQNNRFSVALEQDYSLWAMLAADDTNLNAPEELCRKPGYLIDPDGRGALSAYLDRIMPGYAPLSNLDTMATLYGLVCHSEDNIRVLFNDAAFKEGLLDINAPLTRNIAERFCAENSTTLDDLDPASPDIVSIRNLITTEIIKNHARLFKVPVVFQQTGLNHIFGNARDSCLLENSLYSCLLRAGAAVLPVFPTLLGRAGLNTPPSEARSAFSYTIVVDGLSEECFGRMPEEGFQDWADRETESAFIHSLRAASGESSKFRDRTSLFEAAWWKAVAHRHATEILENYNTSATRAMKSFDLF